MPVRSFAAPLRSKIFLDILFQEERHLTIQSGFLLLEAVLRKGVVAGGVA